MDYEIEMCLRVYDRNTGDYIEVSPSLEGELGMISIRTPNEEYWGAVELDIPVEFAFKLAAALERVASSGETP